MKLMSLIFPLLVLWQEPKVNGTHTLRFGSVKHPADPASGDRLVTNDPAFQSTVTGHPGYAGCFSLRR